MPGPHTQRSGKATSESPRPKEQTLAPRNTGQAAEKARRPRDIRLDHRHRPALDVGLVAKEAGRLRTMNLQKIRGTSQQSRGATPYGLGAGWCRQVYVCNIYIYMHVCYV